MSSPAAAAAAATTTVKGGQQHFRNDGLYSGEGFCFGDQPSEPPLLLPTIIEETETWSKKAASRQAALSFKNDLADSRCAPADYQKGDGKEKGYLGGENSHDLSFDLWSGVEKFYHDEEEEKWEGEEDVHLVSRTTPPFATNQTVEKRASARNGQQQQYNSQNRPGASDNKSSNGDDSDDESRATIRSSSSPPLTHVHHHQQHQHQKAPETFQNGSSSRSSNGSGLLSSIVAQRVLSTLIKPFKSSSRALYQAKRSRSRRNRRTQTDYHHHHHHHHHHHQSSQSFLSQQPALSSPSDGEMKSGRPKYTRLLLLQAPSLVSFSSGNGSSGGQGKGNNFFRRLLLWSRLLLRQLRLPLAILAFVFLFVIQFRANQQQLPPPPAPIPQHFTGGLIQQQQSANYAVANSALAAAAVPYTYLNPSTSSSSSSSSLEEAVASFAVGNNSSLAIQLEAANSANSSSIKDSISNTTTAKSAAAAIMKSVAAPAGSNVLVNRDLQAMPSSVVVGGLVAASVDTVSEVANTVASSSSSSSFSVIVNSISNNGSSSSSSSSQVNKTSNSLNFSSKPPPPPPCPLIPSKLVGRLKVLRHAPPMTELEAQLADVQVGGRYRPADCTPQYKVAIIVPYRDRDEHLRTFLFNIHPMLMRQNIEYGIFIVEQSGSDRFNRAKLMNVGFLEARNHLDYDCFIFHDVDLIPEDDRNLYTCPEQPRHMSVAIDKFRYRLPYKDLFGGVSALTREQFETVNGFSNEFWGWGGEDDDMSNRVRHHKFKITRYKPEIARYTMLKHQQDAPSAERYKKLYNGWRRYDSDGINSTKYQVLDTSFKKLYTWILVDIFPPPMAKKKEEPKRSKQMVHSRFFRPQHRYFARRPI